jgi:hypothetical protein
LGEALGVFGAPDGWPLVDRSTSVIAGG